MTEFTSNLIYRNESGALNESFSDMMGTGVEFFFQPPGDDLALRADYLVGEDAIRPGGLRSMADPASKGDPDHYSKRFLGPEDNGGVHINSAIPNQVFYLAIEGGTNRTSGLSVQGVGGGQPGSDRKSVLPDGDPAAARECDVRRRASGLDSGGAGLCSASTALRSAP